MASFQDMIDAVSSLATTIGDALQLRGFKTGGTAGQVPVKGPGGDFDWEWETIAGGGSLSSFLTADLAPIISQATLQNTGCSVALPVGTWRIQARTIMTNTSSLAGLNFRGTLTGGSFSEKYGRVGISSGGTVSEETKDAAFTTTKLVPTATKGVVEYDFQLEVTSGTCTVATQYSQLSSTATNTTCKVGCYIIATKIA